MDRKTSGSRGRALVELAALAALVTVWLMFRQDHSNSSEHAQHPTEPPQTNKSQPSAVVPSSPSSNATNPSGSAVFSQPAAINFRGRMDKETMLRQLKRWVRKREGHDVEIVTSQDVLDLNGNPASLNVIVTTRPNGELTKQQLKDRLEEAAVREHALREQLAKARQEEYIAGVNRLVGELVESRTAFVTNNGVYSYKLSLLTELPPVLAFWPGLPFETVREQSARSLAETKLGAEIGLHGLVHFTSATALLQFTNRAGASIYIDPFQMTEVSINALQSLRQSRTQRDAKGRESRITSQWTDYLKP